MTIRSLVHLAISILLLFLMTSAQGYAQPACLGDLKSKRIFSVYIVPQTVTSDIFSEWAPFLERLGRETAQCYDLRLSATIPEFEGSLLSGQPDFAFVNPYHAVMAKAKQGYLPLLHDEKNRLVGIIVVRKDGPVNQISDLRGKNIAFPAPNSFAASLLIRAKLATLNINIVPKYVKTHANVFRAVVVGDVSAGGAVNNTFDRENPELKKQLRVLDATTSYAPHPIIAHPRVPVMERDKFVKAIIAMKADDEGRSLLSAINIPSPVISDYEKDYAPLEDLGLDKLVIVE